MIPFISGTLTYVTIQSHFTFVYPQFMILLGVFPREKRDIYKFTLLEARPNGWIKNLKKTIMDSDTLSLSFLFLIPDIG